MKRSMLLLVPCALALALAISGGYGLRVYAEGAPTTKPLFYAGTLEQNGKLATGPHTVALSLFDAEAAGRQLCTSTTPNTPVEGGRFRVELSAECVAAMKVQPDVWATLRFTGPDGVVHELPGRSKVGAVPYALEAQHAVSASVATGGLAAQMVPAGAVMFFNLAACPPGWAALAAAQGRYIVGLPTGGMLAASVGTALGNQENRAVGQHTHPVVDPGHNHGGTTGSVANFEGTDPFRDYIGGGAACARALGYVNAAGCGNSFSEHRHTLSTSPSGVSIASAGTVAGTSAPYLQLLACQKN